MILNNNNGSILIVTIWVVLVLTGLTLVFSRSMRVEAIATANHVSTLETEEIAKGAVAFIKARLKSSDDLDIKLNGETNSPYKAISAGTGYFWLLRPDLDDDGKYAFGISDEPGKINLNEAGYNTLMDLPNMTSELAGSILDWRDTDSSVNEEGGAEDEYYLNLKSPYYCKNSGLETVEEVLLVKGASLKLLFGEDANTNGVLDINEDDGDASEPEDNNNGALDRGFFDYVTVYSKEPNEDSTGSQRININSLQDRQKLISNINAATGNKLGQKINQFFQNYRSFNSVLDFYIKAKNSLGLTADQFKQIEDYLSTSSDSTLTGLVNVATAPKQVLRCLPNLDESDAEALVNKREAEGTDLGSIAWVYDALPEKAASLGRYITIHSYQFSADIVAVSGDGRAFSRYRMVVDTRDSGFKIVYWKALKNRGWPLDPGILTKLRAGVAVRLAIGPYLEGADRWAGRYS
jgi:type II secretory pathway component PulK